MPLLLLSQPQPLTLGCGWVLGTNLATLSSILLQCSKKKDTHEACLSFFVSAARSRLPPLGFKCSGEVNSPCAKVLGRWPKTLSRRKCAAPPRRDPYAPGIYPVLMLHVVAKFALQPHFLCPTLSPREPTYSPPAGPKTPSKSGYGPPGDTPPRRRGTGLPQWEYTAAQAAWHWESPP